MKKIRRKKKRVLPDLGERLLDFSQPLLDMRGNSALLYEAKSCVDIAAGLWNAYSARKASPALLNNAVAKLRTYNSPELDRLVQTLLRRRGRDFGGDMRLIARYEVFDEDGVVRITAASRRV